LPQEARAQAGVHALRRRCRERGVDQKRNSYVACDYQGQRHTVTVVSEPPRSRIWVKRRKLQTPKENPATEGYLAESGFRPPLGNYQLSDSGVRLSLSARRPASVICTRVWPPARARSIRAVARPARTISPSSSTVNPCASRNASVQPCLALPASNSSARRRLVTING
jgi:hypothetical protein